MDTIEQNSIPPEAWGHFENANALIEDAAYADALAECEAALAQLPVWPAALRLRAELLAALGRLTDALAVYEGLLTDDAGDYEILEHWVALRLRLEAESRLERAYALEEDDALAEALLECTAAVGLAPAWAEAHNFHGILLDAVGEPLAALEAYRRAVALDPTFQDARDNLTEAEADLEEYQWVTLARYRGAAEAAIARGRLLVEGIESMVLDEHMSHVIGPMGVGGVRLQVRALDVGQACDILGIELPDEAEDDAV